MRRLVTVACLILAAILGLSTGDKFNGLSLIAVILVGVALVTGLTPTNDERE